MNASCAVVRGGGLSTTVEQLEGNGTNRFSHKAGCDQLCRKSAMYKLSCKLLLYKGTVYPRREERERERNLKVMQMAALLQNLESLLCRHYIKGCMALKWPMELRLASLVGKEFKYLGDVQTEVVQLGFAT